MDPIAVQVVAIVGTLLVALIGYRQWKRQHDFERSKLYREKRIQVYGDLWSMTEDVHLAIRRGALDYQDDRDTFLLQLRRVNEYIIAHELWLDSKIHDRVDSYLEGLHDLVQLLKESKDGERLQILEDSRAFSECFVEQVNEATTLFRETDRIRRSLIRDFRVALGNDNMDRSSGN